MLGRLEPLAAGWTSQHKRLLNTFVRDPGVGLLEPIWGFRETQADAVVHVIRRAIGTRTRAYHLVHVPLGDQSAYPIPLAAQRLWRPTGEANKGLGGGAANAPIPVAQGADERLDGARMAQLAEGPGGGAPRAAIPVAQNADERLDGFGVLRCA